VIEELHHRCVEGRHFADTDERREGERGRDAAEATHEPTGAESGQRCVEQREPGRGPDRPECRGCREAHEECDAGDRAVVSA
jgi:hypothetical protein